MFLRGPCPSVETIMGLIRNPRVHLEYPAEQISDTGFLKITVPIRLESMESLQEILEAATKIPGVAAVHAGVPRKVHRRIA